MIDPTIALGVKPLQVASPLDLMTRQAQYRNLISQGQETQQVIADNQEKLKQSQIQTAKMQVQQRGQEALRQAFVQTGGDPQKTIAVAIQNGADPDTIEGAQKHFGEIEKQKAETDEKGLQNNALRNNQILPIIDHASQLQTSNPQAYAQAWPQIFAQLKQIDPKTSDVASPDQPPTPQQLATAKALHMTDQYFVSQETQKRAQQEQIIKLNDEARKEELQPSLVAEAKGKAVSATPDATGLTPEQAQTAKQAAATLAATTAHNLELEKIQRGELGTKQAEQNLKSKEFEAKYGTAASRSQFTDSVAKDPDSYFSLPPELKIGVANDLVSRGLSVPTQLPSDLKNRSVSAALSLSTIDRVRKLLADPEVNANGPVTGRIAKLMQAGGAGLSSKEQELLTNLNTLTYQESKGLIGGRPSTSMIDAIKASSASPEKGRQQMEGSLKAMEDAAKSVGTEAHTYSFGGAGASSQPVVKKFNPATGKLE